MDFKQAKRNKKWDSWVTIILLFSFLLCTNFIISKIDYNLDLTNDSKYSISNETISRLNKISTSVDIIITIDDNNNQPKIIQKLLHDLGLILQSFQNNKSKHAIRVHHINIDSALSSSAIIEKYKLTERNEIIAITPSGNKQLIFKYDEIESTNILDNNNVFRSKDSLARETVWASGFYGNWRESSSGVMEPNEFKGEEVILQSILKVASFNGTNQVAYFTRGHGEGSPTDINTERGFSELRSLFEQQNIRVTGIDLSTTDQIPEDAKILVITSPKGTFQEQEISLIRDYVNLEGGNLLIALDPVEEISSIDRPAFGLRGILKEWGIRCHDMLIYDPERQNFDVFTGDYSLRTYLKQKPHRVIDKLREGGFSIQCERIRPVETIENNNEICENNEILYSSRNSWAVSSWANREFPPNKNNLLDMEGPIPVIALSEINKSHARNKYLSRGKLAVLGSSSILTNKRLKENSGNRYLAKNIIYWLMDENIMLEIKPKKINLFTLNLNHEDFVQLMYGLAIIPMIIALTGAFVAWLRKEL